jgi:hypothetical protein
MNDINMNLIELIEIQSRKMEIQSQTELVERIEQPDDGGQPEIITVREQKSKEDTSTIKKPVL